MYEETKGTDRCPQVLKDEFEKSAPPVETPKSVPKKK